VVENSIRKGHREDTKGMNTMRFAFKLLFQFRVMIKRNPGKFRRCEERTIVVDNVETAEEAVDRALSYGRNQHRTFTNTAGHKAHFEFVGILDYIELGIECHECEVWYDYVIRKEPMENRKNTTICRAKIIKEMKKKRLDEKKPITIYPNDHSHKNIDVDLREFYE